MASIFSNNIYNQLLVDLSSSKSIQDIDLANYLSASQMSGLESLMAEEKEQSKNDLKLFGAVLTAIIMGTVLALNRRV